MTSAKRKRVYDKTSGHCAYCGRWLNPDDFTIDHVLALSRGGNNDISNLLPCCRDCNIKKANSDLEVLRINLAWPHMRISDFCTFEKVRKASRRYRFYYETL